jgi:hypothetical protein
MAQKSREPKTPNPGRCIFRLAALSLILCAGSVAANDASSLQAMQSSPAPESRFQPGSIQSGEAAEQALSEAGRRRAEIAARFAADERACMKRFFVNSCVADAREHERHGLAEVRKVEVEAKAVQRRLHIEERDRELAEKQTERERKESGRSTGSVPIPAVSLTSANASGRDATDVAPAGGMSDREARHDAKLRRIAEKERADAQKRAEKAAAYDRKILDVQKHQQAVEARTAKAEKK